MMTQMTWLSAFCNGPMMKTSGFDPRHKSMVEFFSRAPKNPTSELSDLIETVRDAGFPGWRAEDKENGKVLDILVYDVISDWWGVSASDIKKTLRQHPKVEDINVFLNSPGGDLFSGLAIRNSLKAHSANVNIIVDGYAASAATVIADAGDTVVMGEGTRFMIHEPWTVAIGNSKAIMKVVSLLESLNNDMVKLYNARSGAGEGQIREWLEAETWFSAEQAVEHGFADRVEKLVEDKDGEDGEEGAKASAGRSQLDDSIVHHIHNALFSSYGERADELRAMLSSSSGNDGGPRKTTVVMPGSKGSTGEDQELKSASRGKEKEDIHMTKEEKDALQAQLSAINSLNETLKAQIETSNKELTEVRNQLKLSEESLSDERAKFETVSAELETTKAKLEDTQVAAEVDGLIGVKLLPEERDRFVQLRKLSPDLFTEMVEARKPLKLTNRIIDGEENPIDTRADSEINDADAGDSPIKNSGSDLASELENIMKAAE